MPNNHTKRINTLCGEKVEFSRVRHGDSCSNHKAGNCWSPGLQTYFAPDLAEVYFESSNTFMTGISISYQLDGKKQRPRVLHWQQCNLHTVPCTEWPKLEYNLHRWLSYTLDEITLRGVLLFFIVLCSLQMAAVQYIATVKDKGSSVFSLWNTKLYLIILLIARCVSITKTNWLKLLVEIMRVIWKSYKAHKFILLAISTVFSCEKYSGTFVTVR
jgi:hypothetical protein